MAIRKFSRYMKAMSLIVVFSLLLTAAYTGYNFIDNYRKLHKVIMKVNNEKIEEKEYLTQLNLLKENVKNIQSQIKANDNKQEIKEISEDVLKQIVLNNLIEEKIAKIVIDGYKVNISKDKVNEIYEKYKENAGGESQLSLQLASYGQTISDLKEQIKQSEELTEVKNKIVSQINVDDKDLQDFYNINKYEYYKDKKYEEIKDQVKSDYLKTEVEAILQDNMDKVKKEATYKYYDESLKPLVEELNKVVNEKYDIKESTVLLRVVNYAVQANLPMEDVRKDVIKALDSQISDLEEIKKLAIEKGIKVNEEVSQYSQLILYLERYRTKFIVDFDATDDEKKALFEQLRAQYDIPESVTGYMLAAVYSASKADEEKTLNKVKEIMKTITKDNFAQKAKELSVDSTRENGGNLGKQDINNYVKEFKDAVSSAKVGDIVGPVKTQFGYHIIYVKGEDENNKNIKDVSHILIPIEISKETKEEQNKKLIELKQQILDKKVNVEDIIKNKDKYAYLNIIEPLTKVLKNSELPKIGYDASVSEELFKTPVGNISEIKKDNYVMLLYVTEKQEYVKAKYEDYKEQVRIELAKFMLSYKHKL